MIIGMDISLQECKESGYLMLKYDARKSFNHNTEIELRQYYNKELQICHYTVEELWSEYLDRKTHIDSFCDCNFQNISEITSYSIALFLADSINSYCSLYWEGL